MSISSSLNAGVAGLNANATRLSAISDNIANAGTYGYKRVEASFESFVISGNAGAGKYSAGGVRADITRLISERAGPIPSDNPTDLAVTGRGFLPVTRETSLDGSGGDQELLMTRTASFEPDENGILKTKSGLVLLGWPANGDGTFSTFPRDTTTGLEPVRIGSNQNAGDPTTRMTLGVNLPAADTEAGSPGEALPLSVEYFGNLGTSESLNITFVPVVPSDGSSNKWTMVVRDSAQKNDVIGQYTLTFDDSRPEGGTLEAVEVVSGGAYDASRGVLELEVGGGPLEVTIGRLGELGGGLSQLSNSFSTTGISKNGSSVGNLASVAVDESGVVTATFDTGFTRPLYQIPLVDVSNQNGLKSLANQTYQVSPESGSFFLWNAGDGPTGAISGFAREASATDVAGELTALIETQRSYTSNAKIIQTVDEMLQETTNIKR